MNRMKSLVLAASLLPLVTTSLAAQNREVRLLDANDVALPSVLFAAAKHVFDPNASQILGFGDVYVNKRRVPSLSADVRNYITRIGGFRPTSRPVDCEPSAGRPAPRGPTPPAVTGGAPNPSSQPTRTTGAAICNRGADVTYTFTGVRIASDTAYLEMEVEGVARASTKCLALTVDKDAGGWTPRDTKNSKVGQCGK